MRKFLLFSPFIFFALSCGDQTPSGENFYQVPQNSIGDSSGKKDTSIKDLTDSVNDIFEPGKVMHDLPVENAPGLTYDLYLPVGYKKTVPFPVIYFFDPQGKGGKPLEMYKSLADKYRFVLIGSNNIRNGIEQGSAEKIALALWKDTHGKLSLVDQRGYLCGFSGGARYAGSLFQHVGAHGVISCSAGFPMLSPIVSPDMIFIGIAGLKDMNSLELRKQERMYDNAVSNAMLYFDGGHEWPPLETMNEALLFLTVREMAFHKRVQTNIIDSLSGVFSEQLLFSKKKRDTISQVLVLDKKIRFLSSAIDDKEEMKMRTTLMNSPSWKKFILKQKQEEDLESQQQHELIKLIQSGNTGLLDSKLDEIKKLSLQGKSGPAKFMNARLLGFVSLLAYSKSHEALRGNDMKALGYFVHIYRLVDPVNPEQAYLNALLASSGGRCADCAKYLEESVKLGFADTARFDAEVLLDRCRNELTKVRTNMAKSL